jgi:uncharacterized protein (TIGR02231 family)
MTFKFYLIVSLSFAMLTPLAASGTVSAETRVSRVIVYPEWAYVTRSTTVDLGGREGRVVLEGLPAWIDHDSILVKASPAGSAEIRGVTAGSVYLQKITEKEVERARLKVVEMEDRLNDYYTEIDVLEEQLQYIKSIAPWKAETVPHEGTVRPVSTSELAEVGEYLRSSIHKVMTRKNEINRIIRDLQPELAAVQNEWNEIASRARYEQSEIVIDLETTGRSTVDLEVSYLISGASWYPRYDARTSEGSNEIEIICTAIVQQTTGEDWSSAEFILSTIKPYLIRQRPELNPWIVNETYSAEESNVSLNRGSNEDYITRLNDLKTKQDMLYNFQEENQQAYSYYEQNIIQAKEVARQAEERGTTIEFTINGNYSVFTDGKPVKMMVGRTSLQAERYYSSIPVVSQSTYVTGTIKNEADFPFLPGVVEVYNNGNFIGKSRIDFVATRERFELYMGLAERIKVSRSLDARKSAHALFGKKKVLTVGYNIEVHNFMDEAVTIAIQDQVPISQSSQVKIKLVSVEPRIEPDEQGIMEWVVDLGPQEKRTCYFEFEIEYPGNVYLENAMELEKQLKMMY